MNIENRNTETTIEKHIVVRASRARVWRAIADSKEFGTWFGMRIDGPFVAGRIVRGVIAPTEVDPEVAAMQKPHEGTPVALTIETMEPEHVFAFRWHPSAVDEATDYSAEPTTLVTFTLADDGTGCSVTVTESGFEHIPLARRAAAFTSNDGGWTAQMRLIARYLETRA